MEVGFWWARGSQGKKREGRNHVWWALPGEKARGREPHGAEKVVVSAEGQPQPAPWGPLEPLLPPWRQPLGTSCCPAGHWGVNRNRRGLLQVDRTGEGMTQICSIHRVQQRGIWQHSLLGLRTDPKPSSAWALRPASLGGTIKQ